jgi:hypothetical protein
VAGARCAAVDDATAAPADCCCGLAAWPWPKTAARIPMQPTISTLLFMFAPLNLFIAFVFIWNAQPITEHFVALRLSQDPENSYQSVASKIKFM